MEKNKMKCFCCKKEKEGQFIDSPKSTHSFDKQTRQISTVTIITNKVFICNDCNHIWYNQN